MTQLQSHLSRGGFFSFQKKKRSQMVLSIKMKWPYIIIVLINEEARIWNKVLSKCCQNAFFAKKLRFVSAQEKSPKFRAFLWLRGRFSSVTQKSTSRSCWAGKCDCFCDNTGEHDCRLLFFAVEVLIFAGSKTGLTLENGLKVCLTGKSERCGDLTV